MGHYHALLGSGSVYQPKLVNLRTRNIQVRLCLETETWTKFSPKLSPHEKWAPGNQSCLQEREHVSWDMGTALFWIRLQGKEMTNSSHLGRKTVLNSKIEKDDPHVSASGAWHFLCLQLI